MKHDPTVLQDDELQYGLDYFFRKATVEVKKYCNLHTKNSYKKGRVLYCSSRVDAEQLSFVGKMTPAMIDLSSGSFMSLSLAVTVNPIPGGLLFCTPIPGGGGKIPKIPKNGPFHV